MEAGHFNMDTKLPKMHVNILPIQAGDEDQIAELSSLLTRSFRMLSPAWVPTVDRAREVIEEALDPAYINRILVMDHRVVGWYCKLVAVVEEV